MRDKTAFAVLRVSHVIEPLPVETPHIERIYGTLSLHLGVPCVSEALTVRAVAAYAAVEVVRLGAEISFVYPVKKII